MDGGILVEGTRRCTRRTGDAFGGGPPRVVVLWRRDVGAEHRPAMLRRLDLWALVSGWGWWTREGLPVTGHAVNRVQSSSSRAVAEWISFIVTGRAVVDGTKGWDVGGRVN